MLTKRITKRVIKISIVLASVACQHTPSEKSKVPTSYSGHGKHSLATEILEKYAPRSLPPQLVHQIEVLNDIRSPGSALIDQNAENLYFNWSVTGVNQVWKLDGPLRFPQQLTASNEATFLRAVLPQSQGIIVSRDRAGDEYDELYIMRPGQAQLELIVPSPGPQTRVNFEGHSKDGRYINYGYNLERGTKTALRKKNIITLEDQLLVELTGTWSIADRWEELDLYLLVQFQSNTGRAYSIYDAKNKELKPLIGHDENEQYYVQFARTPDEFIVLTNKFEDFRRIYLKKDNNLRPLTDKKQADIAFFTIDEQHQRLLYLVNDNGVYRAHARLLKNLQPLPLPTLYHPQAMSSFANTSQDGRYTLIAQSSPQSPRDYFLLDWKTQKTQRWTLPGHPEVDLNTFLDYELHYAPTHDGIQIPIFVKVPKQCRKKTCPIIVNFHGGPEAQSLPSFNPMIDFYIEHGYIYALPNVRGSSGYGKEWLNADNQEKRLEVLTDIRDVGLYLKEKFSIDKKPKIGVTGGSYGGYATLVAMTKYAGTYDAGVSIVGMGNLETFLENTADYRRALRESEYGTLEHHRDLLKKLSPIHYLDQVTGPLLIIHGATDPRVPAGEAVQMTQALEKQNKEVELILFADEGHGVRKRANRTKMAGHTFLFFEKHLKDKN